MIADVLLIQVLDFKVNSYIYIYIYSFCLRIVRKTLFTVQNFVLEIVVINLAIYWTPTCATLL